MSFRNLLFALVCLVAITSSVVAVRQQMLLRELRQALIHCQHDSDSLQAQVSRLEDNLHSAGLQMSNLSELIQEATTRAARCTTQPTD